MTLEQLSALIQSNAIGFSDLVSSGMDREKMIKMYEYIDDLALHIDKCKDILDSKYEDVMDTDPREEPEYNREA